MILSVLLLTGTIVAARLSLSEAEQSSDVNQSDASYYAAEGGVEEAIRRLDANPDPRTPLEEIFPEQYQNGTLGGDLYGDRLVMVDGDGDSDPERSFSDGIVTDAPSDWPLEYGRLAWRQRKVYDSGLPPVGTMVKDESTQLDASDLRRDCTGGNTAGETSDTDCDGNSIYDNFSGIEFCWSPVQGDPQLELTVISWPFDDVANIATNKGIFTDTSGTLAVSPQVSVVNAPSGDSSYANCRFIQVNDSSRRYIFRVRALFDVGNVSDPDSYQLDYSTTICGISCEEEPALYTPDNIVLIDVVGRSGDIRRRIVARKERQGRILGIFDYVLYSGDPTLPLCKAGVLQSDVGYDENCIVTPPTGVSN